jgi:protocatechuate 3,4-dioxygenase alpha subunit
MTYQIPEQGTGPLYTGCLMFEKVQQAVAPDSEGAIRLHGKVFDVTGQSIVFPGSMIEFFGDGVFARGQGNESGEYEVVIKKPAPDALPDGQIQAPHLDLAVFIHPTLYRLRTRVYFPNETAANAADPVLKLVPAAMRDTLIAVQDGKDLRFDIHLDEPHQTAFLASAA